MSKVDKQFMELAIKAGMQTNCPRPDRRVGAVIVKNNVVLSQGCNSIAKRLEGICDKCCYRKDNNIPSGTCMERCYSLCAEQNAIYNALRSGADLNGATIYTTLSPCAICARWIIFVGITKVVYLNTYNDSFSENMLKYAGVKTQSLKM